MSGLTSRFLLGTFMRAARVDYVEHLGEAHITDLRTINAGFRVLDRTPVYKAGLDHVSESLIARAESIPTSRVVATCGYYLCVKLIDFYSSMGDGQSPTAIALLARRCGREGPGRDPARLLVLGAALNNRFIDAKTDVVEAVTRAIASLLALRPSDLSDEIRCRALTTAMYAALEIGQINLVKRLSEQLAEEAISDGYRAIAALFSTRVGEHDESGYIQTVHAAVTAVARLGGSDPASNFARDLAQHIEGDLTGSGDAERPEPYRNFTRGTRLMVSGDYERAAPFLDSAANDIGDRFVSAMAAIFAFSSHVYVSRDLSRNEIEHALEDLTLHDFAAAKHYWNCSLDLRKLMFYCAARSEEAQYYAWLTVRVADLLGEYSAGAAIESGPALDRTADTSSRELAIIDLLTGSIRLPSEEMLRMASRDRTIIWVNLLTVDDEPNIFTFVLGPHDERPQVGRTIIRSDRAHRILDDARSASLEGSPDDLDALRRWIIQCDIDTSVPLMIVPDRQLWPFPWADIVPKAVSSLTLMPSVASALRLAAPPPAAGLPVVAGVFDEQLAGARAELAALDALHREGKIVFLRATSLPELRRTIAEREVDLLTIAAHGTSWDGFEYRILFPESSTSPTALLGMRLPPHVVLGCCWSARLGERADSIATALACLSAGAGCVVGALWDVDDKIAGDILASAYRDFAAGKPLPNAVRAAYLRLPGKRISGAALSVHGLA